MKYYLNTSIWLDLFEDRDEPNLPKGEYAEKFIEKVISEDSEIVYSNAVKDEVANYGYSTYEVDGLFNRFKEILVYAEATNKQIGKAKDIAAKRSVPVFDALHALIAKDKRATLITRDRHFKQLRNITIVKKPEELI